MAEKCSIDLHGLRVNEAIRRFVWFYNDCVRRRIKGPIEVVHGYGSTSENLRSLLTLRGSTSPDIMEPESWKDLDRHSSCSSHHQAM